MSAEFYEEYIENNRAIIYKICRAYARSEADFQDLFQEVCLQLWKSRDRFDNSSKLSTWIYRVTLNTCLTMTRHERREPAKVAVRETDVVTGPAEPDEESLRLEALYAALKKLSEADRAVILLYLEEKSYKEIAEILGISLSNVGVKINRIKTKLTELITNG
ncbi:RNA polymerase sigma factor [Roseivirga sp. BDSF3-8]|uniref:RNA polymerase sigma factor n=1 Tax=Roseivirga sp. BDSF3-8 TaxID=3241598 RepID=UPI0035318214